MKYHVLPKGDKMPLLGLGTWQSAPGEVRQAVETAIDAGYRYFDCAYAYQNEAEVGEAIANKISEGKVAREDLFICTKLHIQFLRKDMVRKCLESSLEKLKLKYVDLWIIHAPVGMKFVEGNLFPQGKENYDSVDHLETWGVMEQLVDEGLIKYIGLSNFNHKQIQNIIDKARIKPSNLQVECHAYFQQKRLHAYCKERGISFTAYSPLGSPGRPSAMSDKSTPAVLEDATLKEIADKKGKKSGQIALRFLVEEGISVIPKSTNPARIKENFDIFDFELTKEEMEQIRGIDKNLRLFQMGRLVGVDHPDNPMKEEF